MPPLRLSSEEKLAREKQAIRTIASNELVVYAGFVNTRYEPSWLHRTIAKKLEAVEKGRIRRLIITVPPRHGKSELSSVIFPSWYLGRHPSREIIVASYSAELAEDFGYKTRSLVDGPEYGELFDVKLQTDSKSKGKWRTKNGGSYTAVGVGGAITGRGANILLIDDPLKNREEAESSTIRDKVWNWFTSTAYTRLEKDGAVILILTRWHRDDLAGRLLEAQKNGGEKWDVVNFPALATEDEKFRKEGEPLWPEKYGIEDLERIKKTVGIYDWQALYQQNPVASETQEFKPEYYRYRTMEEVQALVTNRILTVDTAISKKSSADYTGFCLNFVDSENKWNIKAWKKRIGPLELIDDLFALCDNYRIDTVGIEKTIYLQAVKPFLDQEMRRRNKFLNIVELNHNQTHKETRIRALLPRYESGSVYHITDCCEDLEEDQISFPKGMHDDVLDAEAYQVQIAVPPANHESFEPVFSATW